MNKETKLHIKKLQNRAILSLVAILLTFMSIAYGVLFLFASFFAAAVFFAIAIISIVYLIYISCIVKKESKESVYKPVVFSSSEVVSFEKSVAVFENLTDKENQITTSNDVRFFRLNEIFELRAVLYKSADFIKKDFNNAKHCINKKANKELNISSRVNRFEAGKMMRFNIIFADTLNDELYQLVSQNANHNLTRVEGIINIVIVGNQIMIPPIYGDCDLGTIIRYKNVIKFINNILLNNSK